LSPGAEAHVEALLTVKELADKFKVTEKLVRRLVQVGDLPALRIGREFRFQPTAVNRWLAEQARGHSNLDG